MTLAIQVVDVQTCQPVPDAFLDIWSSNATVRRQRCEEPSPVFCV